ncbi:MAG: Exopolysaccharide production protein ExoY [Oscillospiraceae bacterium]|jgi:lipopolysaccharide/colanic/teichoic acid biosynthesis glycosyltransferase
MTYAALPQEMKNEFTQAYWNLLQKKRAALAVKRAFDIIASFIILLIFSPVLLILALAIKLDSPGPVFYRQVRVGRYNRDFKIYKFRTMVQDADKIGPAVTTGEDKRITRVGKFIRRCRLDEFSQLINVLNGTMSLVGPRPEIRRYVDAYSPEGMATLLIRPGITAPSSIAFKDEDRLLVADGDPDKIYIERILPPKTQMNLEYLRNISVLGDIKIIFQTIAAVI